MELNAHVPTGETVDPEDEAMPIIIRKLDRLETTSSSNSQGT